jgi:hypothetical protein
VVPTTRCAMPKYERRVSLPVGYGENMQQRLRSAGLIVASALFICSGNALAQTSPPSGTAASGATTLEGSTGLDESKLKEARVHYARGVQLYTEGALDNARVELQRAYALAPSYRILYNIGLVQRGQFDFVGAIHSFDQYLKEGGSGVPDARRSEVEQLVREMNQNVGKLTVKANVDGATFAVDDVPVGTAPMTSPILVNPGRRRITVTKPGKMSTPRVVDVAGADTLTLTFEMQDSRTVVLVDKPSRRVPWAGWGATGVFTAGAITFGLLARSASSDYDNLQASSNTSHSALKSATTRSDVYSVIADTCIAGAVVSGGFSLYYTIKWGKEASAQQEEKSVGATLTGNGLAVFGKF